MRRMSCILSTLGLALSLAACTTTKKSEEEQLTPEQKALQERQAAAASTQQTIQQFERQRQQYKIQAENKLNDLEAKIAALKASAPSDPTQRESHQATVSQL